jgi:DOPA 4,5-dioxygenase
MQEDQHTITGYHAHVYYDAGRIDAARELCAAAREQFGVAMGRMHERPVGPHPQWSCQLSVPLDRFATVIPWLARNRGDLTVFVHVLTGDEWFDHTQGVMWLGPSEPLQLDIFKPA